MVPGAICELDTVSGAMRELLAKTRRVRTPYPYSFWDGKWIAFECGRGARHRDLTAGQFIRMCSLPAQSEWVEISLVGRAFASAVRAGWSRYRLPAKRRISGLVRQDIEPATEHGYWVSVWSLEPVNPCPRGLPIRSARSAPP